jgi:hypothetical protein
VVVAFDAGAVEVELPAVSLARTDADLIHVAVGVYVSVSASQPLRAASA